MSAVLPVRFPRRLVAACGGMIVSVAVLLAGAPGVRADDAGTATTLLDRSREAAAGHEFRGTMVVEWRDANRLREREVSVRVADGVMHMGRGRIVGVGTRRLLKTDTGWRLLWTDASKESTPDPSRKYRFAVKRAASVAGRSTTPVAIAREGESAVRERLFFDRASGLLLRRDQLDASGRIIRRVAFAEISTPEPVRDGKDGLPKVARKSGDGAPWSLQEVPDDLSAPKRIGDGFVLLGMYGRPEGSTQLFYSDGLVGLSVFETAGELAWDELPAGGHAVELGGVRARVYPTAAGSAVLWESGDVTYTCVTDAPLDEIENVAADFARWEEEPSTLEDIGRFVTGPFSWG